MERKKILIIENSIHVTGALNSVLRTSLALKANYDFVFALPLQSKASALVKESGFQVFEIPMLELSKKWQSILFYFPNLIRSISYVQRLCREHQIAFVHVNDFYNLIMPLWRLCGGSLPYVCHVNFVPDRFPKLLRKLWINSHMIFAHRIITVSQHVLVQLPISKKVICIPNALPVEIDSNAEEVGRQKTLLFVGNFMEGKGQDLAIRAFAFIAKSYPDWKLRFVGGDMGMEKNIVYQAKLVKLSEELGIEMQIEWSGFIGDVKAEYHQASIALNFSRSESFSLTVQEAMFYGCPVIATCSGGPQELIEDKFSGLLVPIDDVEAMSKAMNYFMKSADERLRIKINAARSIREKCSKANTIDQLDLAYQSVNMN